MTNTFIILRFYLPFRRFSLSMSVNGRSVNPYAAPYGSRRSYHAWYENMNFIIQNIALN